MFFNLQPYFEGDDIHAKSSLVAESGMGSCDH